jgi:CDP-diacylglycerol--glycerol-3-phosphate 3-phosphatidyltransferase
MLNSRLFTYKNVPNALSLARMLLALPFILIIHDIFVYQCAKNLGLLLIFTGIILSDIADGCLARKLKCASDTGAKLDIISDALYTVLSLSVFAYFKIIPVWFVFIMLFKLAEFIITSRIIKRRRQSQGIVFFDTIGKLSVCAVMLLPGVFVFRCVIIEYKIVMNAVIYVITAMLALSFASRVISILRAP